jgi:hypothetical protein
MFRQSFLIVGFFASVAFPIAFARGGVTKTEVDGKITWSDDFLRPGGAEFYDQQQQYDYCINGLVPRPEYTASDPVVAGGYNSASVTVGNGIMGINHDEFQPTAIGIPVNVAIATLGWQNTVGLCMGGSNVGEHDAPFDDNDICMYGGVKFNAWHLRFSPQDHGPWGPDGKSGYAGVDDDGDGTTDYGHNYVVIGHYDQAASGAHENNCCQSTDGEGDLTPDQMEVLGTFDDSIHPGCTHRFPRVELYTIQAVKEGPYPNNGIDDDLDGTIDNEEPWEATIRRDCDGSFVLPSNGTDDDQDGTTDESGETGIFESGVTYPLEAGLSLRFTNFPPATQIGLDKGGRWEFEIWPKQSWDAVISPSVPSYANEIYGRNQRFNKGNPGYVDPHGPDGKAGVAGIDDDGNGLTDEFPTEGRPNTDDDSDGITDEFDEVVLDELGERNFGDDADDTMGRGAQAFALRTEIGVGSSIRVNIDPGSGGSNLFSIRELVVFQDSAVSASDEIGPGFYVPNLNYGFVWCTSGSCYGAQMWIGNDAGNPVETLGPVVSSNHTGTEVGVAAGQFGSGLVSLMERWPLVTNALYDDKFWAIEGTTSKPTVTVLQDRDRDGDVDGVDFSVFASCFNKAGNPPRTVGCTADDAAGMDADNDGDVDGVDFSVFASCFNKAGNSPRAPGCYPVVSSITACGS